MTLLVPSSGSVIAADGVIAHSASAKYCVLFLIADAGAAGSANITMGTPAASTIMTLRAAAGTQSPPVGIIPSTCLTVAGLENGDVICLVKV